METPYTKYPNLYDYQNVTNGLGDVIGYNLTLSKNVNECPSSNVFCSDFFNCITPSLTTKDSNSICFYPIQSIQNDADLKKLNIAKGSGLINPKLADELAANYCFSTVDGANCGTTTDDKTITKCIRMKIDQTSADSSNKPCIEWFNDLTHFRTDYDSFINGKTANWCAIPSNKYTPLCDCNNKTDRSASFPNNIRDFYNTLTNKYDTLLTNVPPSCWFTPCQTNSYSLPYINLKDQCPVVSNICNQIMQGSDDATKVYMNNNSQTLNCNATGNFNTSGTNNTNIVNDNTPSESNSFISKPSVYIPIIVIIIVVILVIINTMMSSIVKSAVQQAGKRNLMQVNRNRARVNKVMGSNEYTGGNDEHNMSHKQTEMHETVSMLDEYSRYVNNNLQKLDHKLDLDISGDIEGNVVHNIGNKIKELETSEYKNKLKHDIVYEIDKQIVGINKLIIANNKKIVSDSTVDHSAILEENRKHSQELKKLEEEKSKVDMAVNDKIKKLKEDYEKEISNYVESIKNNEQYKHLSPIIDQELTKTILPKKILDYVFGVDKNTLLTNFNKLVEKCENKMPMYIISAYVKKWEQFHNEYNAMIIKNNNREIEKEFNIKCEKLINLLDSDLKWWTSVPRGYLANVKLPYTIFKSNTQSVYDLYKTYLEDVTKYKESENKRKTSALSNIDKINVSVSTINTCITKINNSINSSLQPMHLVEYIYEFNTAWKIYVSLII